MAKLKINKLKFLLIVCAIVFCFTGFSFNKAYANEKEINLLNENFAYDSVLVVLDRNISGINKVHAKEFFGGVEISSIEDLTYTQNPQNVKEDFCQILKLNLIESSRDSVINAIKTISQIQGVKSVEPNYMVETTSVDEKYNTGNSYLWGLFNSNYGINIEQAWGFTTGSRDIRVGIIDSGVYNHLELDNLVQGYDFEHSSFETYDDKERHGTKVAGVIGAKANSGENSPCGVNWDVSLVPLQVWVEEEYPTEALKDAAFIENVLKAILWAQEQWGTESQIDILNCSITGYQTTVVRTAIQYFNGLVVFAAGNERPENGDIDSIFNSSGVVKPANLIIVGAIDSAGEVPTDWDGGKGSCYSSSGEHVNIYAPGDMIFTTSFNPPAQDYIATVSGTSFAAPHVTGVAALLLSLNSNLTATQLKTAIISSAKSHTTTLPNGQEQTINVLDAYNAVKYVLANHNDGNIVVSGSKTRLKRLNGASDIYNKKKSLLKLTVNEGVSCRISVSANYATKVTLFDDSFNVETTLLSGLINNYILDTPGVYYLQTEFVEEVVDTITIYIDEMGVHSHSGLWMYYSNSQHRRICSCGETFYESHCVEYQDSRDGYATCLGCGANLNLGLDFADIIRSIGNKQVTLNGSYILPSGVVVLKEEDVDAYMAGTLVFYNENELPTCV